MPSLRDDPPTPAEFVDAALHWLRHWRNAPREKSKVADWAMVVLAAVTAFYAFRSARIFWKQFNEMQRQEQNDLSPYVDLTRVTVVDSPLDNGRPMVVLTFINEGKTPAKNARVMSTIQLLPREPNSDHLSKNASRPMGPRIQRTVPNSSLRRWRMPSLPRNSMPIRSATIDSIFMEGSYIKIGGSKICPASKVSPEDIEPAYFAAHSERTMKNCCG